MDFAAMQGINTELAPFLRQLMVVAPAAAAILAGAAVSNLLLARAVRLLSARTRYNADRLAPIGRLGRFLVNGAALILLLGILGCNLGGIWAMFATVVGMVAIGFVAVWSVLSNALCTLIILAYRPFEVGDELEFPGEQICGKVADLNFIYTTLCAPDGSWLQVPNNLFLQKVVRRRRGTVAVSLAEQLAAERPARV